MIYPDGVMPQSASSLDFSIIICSIQAQTSKLGIRARYCDCEVSDELGDVLHPFLAQGSLMVAEMVRIESAPSGHHPKAHGVGHCVCDSLLLSLSAPQAN